MPETRSCKLCGRPARMPDIYRCAVCDRLVHQGSLPGPGSPHATAIPVRIAEGAVQQALDLHARLHPDAGVGYACHYSQIPLVVSKAQHYYGDYVSFDHVVPNDPSRAVLCSRLMNNFKSWLTEEEFRDLVGAVMRPDERRHLDGLSVDDTRRLLHGLRSVMADAADAAQARRTVAELSHRVTYHSRADVGDPVPARD